MQRSTLLFLTSSTILWAACSGAQRNDSSNITMKKLAGVWHAVDLDGKYQLEVSPDGEFVQRVTPTGGDDCEQRGQMFWYRGEKRSPGKLPEAGPDAPVLVAMPPNRAVWVDVESNSCTSDAIGSRLEVLPSGNLDERLPLHIDRMGLASPRSYKRYD
jgi:hypothetical protein